MRDKLEQQIDKALTALAAHKKPVRYIVRKPRPEGKGRHAKGNKKRVGGSGIRTLAGARAIVERLGVDWRDMNDEDLLGCSVKSHHRWMREADLKHLRGWAEDWAREMEEYKYRNR